MKLYTARHGETEWNALNKVLGRTDAELNENGLLGARKLADRLENTDIQLVITSPLQRAYITGKTVADRLKIPCRTEDRLIEQNYGIYEGVDRDDPAYQKAKREYFARYPQGESFLDVAARVYPFLEELKTLQEKSVLLLTHGGILRVIHSYFADMDNEEFVTFTTPNCGYREYDL